MKKDKRLFIVPILVGIGSLILVFAGIFLGWFGAEREGIMLFCEHARDGFIKQPSNTFSNVGFMASGMYLGYLFYTTNFAHKNLMTTTLFYPIFFSSIVVFLGPGSMAMHATNAYWGGFTDLFSMFLFSSFVFTYALVRFFNWSKNVFLTVYIASIIICSWVYLSPWNTINFPIKVSEICFGSLLLLGTFLELGNRYWKGNKIKSGWGYMTILTFFVAFFIWIISRTQDSWFCDPHSLIQGHAIWHLLNALAAYFLFLFYTSEEIGLSSLTIE